MMAMEYVEDLPHEANAMARVRWRCVHGHQGIAYKGVEIVCRECCHGGSIPRPFACPKCGATSYDDERLPCEPPGWNE